MAIANITRSLPGKASERPGLPLAALAASLPLAILTHAPKRPARKAHAMPALLASGGSADVLSFRRELADHERAVIDAAFTILGCYLREPGAVFAAPNAVKEYFGLHLAGERRELFAVLYLDSQHCAIALETPFTGTLTQTSVYPREIVRAALAHGAASVIFAHNHPGGRATPSKADEGLTQTLKKTLALVDVRVLDHLIIAGDQATSMAELGLL